MRALREGQLQHGCSIPKCTAGWRDQMYAFLLLNPLLQELCVTSYVKKIILGKGNIFPCVW